VKKGGARLLGRAAVRPFDNIINDLKFRLHLISQESVDAVSAEFVDRFVQNKNCPETVRSRAV
jgi:hypothetical protein